MSSYTTNLNLEKPANTDYVDIAVFNSNADKIDTFAGTVVSDYVQDSSYVHTDNNFTSTLKNKLDDIESNANNYSLPTASTSTLGGVKVDGTTVTIDSNGIISSTASGGGGTTVVANPTASATEALEKLQVGSTVYSSGGTTVIGNPSGTATTSLTKVQIANTVYSVANYTEVSGTLTAGSTSVTLSDSSITTSSTIEPFTDIFGVNPTNMSVSTGSVTLTFEAQQSNLGVKVRVS